MADEHVPTRSLRAGSAGIATTDQYKPGDRVGAWIIGDKLGAGGFGDVYAAEHNSTKHVAALKVLHAHFTASAEMVARFDREVKVLALLRHPNVVQVIDAGFDNAGRPYLCMERLHGKDLGTLLHAKRHFDTEGVRRILDPLCDAIATAHELGIIHRDLKASNVFVCEPDGRVVLLDFGIAKISDALAPELTASHQSLGTPGCMAPEQIHGQHVDARTDVYALGGLLFQLLTGRLPFQDPSETMTQYLHLHARRPRASSLVAVSPAVDEVIVRAMAIESGQRFADVRTFAAAARNALRESPHSAPPRTLEHAAIFVTIRDVSAGNDLEEALMADLEAVLPAAERAFTERGFSLALDLGTSALFIAPLRDVAAATDAAVAVYERLERRAGRDARVRLGLAVHRGMATVTGDRVEPCALLRPETWGMPDPLEGVWATSAIEPTLRRLR
jgi:eukaryotic-like serine/threonine-protein kinase